MKTPSQFELEARRARNNTRRRLLTRPHAYASQHLALVTFQDAQIGCRAELQTVMVGHVYGFRGFVINDDGAWELVSAVERVLSYCFEDATLLGLGVRQSRVLNVRFYTHNFEISAEHIVWWFPELAIPVWEEENCADQLRKF